MANNHHIGLMASVLACLTEEKEDGSCMCVPSGTNHEIHQESELMWPPRTFILRAWFGRWQPSSHIRNFRSIRLPPGLALFLGHGSSVLPQFTKLHLDWTSVSGVINKISCQITPRTARVFHG